MLILLLAPIAVGCGALAPSTWHSKFNWKAEDYFTDKQVIELCRAIEANDLEEMKRLIAAGADVNAKGKGNMTPLLWAFPDNRPERFKLLLENGADPNVIVASDFNTKNQGIRPGDSVTHMAAKTDFPKQFEYVMQHGGDPNLVNPETGDPLLFVLIHGARHDRVKLAVEKGADVNQKNGSGVPPVIESISWFAQFDLALYLLSQGADPGAYIEEQNMKLIHMMLVKKAGLHRLSTQQQTDYHKLEQRVVEIGESFEEAEADIKRWESWKAKPPSEFGRLRRAEMAARKAKEEAKRLKKE